MTIERAMEILDPEHREHYDSIETVNEACRMGIYALKELEKNKKLVGKLRARIVQLESELMQNDSHKFHNYSNAPNRCVSCGAVIPEGRQICPICETKQEV